MSDPTTEPSGLERLLTRTAGAAGLQAAVFGLCSLPVWLGLFDDRAANHDIAWLSYCSGRLLDGAVPYVDFIENNPPLILWLGTIPVGLARWLELSERLAYAVFVLLLVALSVLAAGRLLRRCWPEPSPARLQLVLALVQASLLLVPGYDFGQRDHLAVVLLVPYLVSSAAFLADPDAGSRRGGLVGLWAAPGLALKPHFLLVWVGVETVLALRTRRWRVWRRRENATVALFLAGYAVLVLLLTPGFFEVARWSLELTGAYAKPVSPAHPSLRVCWAALVCLVAVRSAPALVGLRSVCLAALVALMLSVVLQNRGFPYHFVPAAVVAWIGIGLTVLGLAERRAGVGGVARLSPRGAAVALLVAIGSVAAVKAGRAYHQAFLSHRPYIVTELARLVRQYAPQGPIVVFSTRVYPGFPLVTLTGAAWSSRFANLWIVPGVYTEAEKRRVPFPYHDPEEMGTMERFQIDAVIEDLQRTPPELIVFDHLPKKQGMGITAFDYREYLLRDPRFRRIFAGYRRVADLGGYEVFVRREDAGRSP